MPRSHISYIYLSHIVVIFSQRYIGTLPYEHPRLYDHLAIIVNDNILST